MPGRKHTDQQAILETNVAVAALAPRAHHRHENDRHERGGLGAELREVGEDHQRGHEEDPAPYPHEAAGHPGRKAKGEQAGPVERIHQKTRTAADASSNTMKARATARSEMRCWSAVPATTPATAGIPIRIPFRRSTLP
jgi:hypothetical protein